MAEFKISPPGALAREFEAQLCMHRLLHDPGCIPERGVHGWGNQRTGCYVIERLGGAFEVTRVEGEVCVEAADEEGDVLLVYVETGGLVALTRTAPDGHRTDIQLLRHVAAVWNG